MFTSLQTKKVALHRNRQRHFADAWFPIRPKQQPEERI
jgi:hypothetical protein